MGIRYVNISIEEMRAFLLAKGGNLTEGVQNDEIVFDFPHPRFNSIIVRIFTGIAKSTLQSRGCGEDALRVCAVDYSNPSAPRGYIKSHTAYRTKNWKLNLRDRTKTVIEEVIKRKNAPPFRLQGEQASAAVSHRPARISQRE